MPLLQRFLKVHRWTSWLMAWLATVAVGLLVTIALVLVWSQTTEVALVNALGEKLAAQAGLMASSLQEAPLEDASAPGAEEARADVGSRISALIGVAGLQSAALFPPEGPPIVSPTHPWHAPLSGTPPSQPVSSGTTVGAMFRTAEGRSQRAAYTSVPGHPGWRLGVEGSGAFLDVVDRVQTILLLVTGLVLLLTSIVGALLAAAVTLPLARLDREIRRLKPGAVPEDIHVDGPVEVRGLAMSVRALLGAICERDVALTQAHSAQVVQVQALAAAVAHEVRNPLHALSLTLETLAHAEDPDRRLKLTTRASRNIKEIEDIVGRFLDLSKPVEPRFAQVALRTVVAEAIADGPGPAAVRLEEGPRVTAWTDPNLVRQVLWNLLRNAEEAGATQVRIRVEPGAITVEDDGPGIEDAMVGRIFEWFHTTRATGTGLGLPQSRRICRALGGDLVLVRLRPATFRLDLRQEAP
ncbi:MAG: HAMP domain-containing histidine kinase [Deltaproteobacteria bacterium]|nr:HAMP domain-containing histidine kinase [Deltaproteobacteria bacterium]